MKSLYCILSAMLIYVSISSCISQSNINLCCNENNDLYLTLKENRIPCKIYSTPDEAIKNVRAGSGILILADGYPAQTTRIDPELFEMAKLKNLRIYIEYPSVLPGLIVPAPRQANLERVVVTSDKFDNLSDRQILTLHSCYYVPVAKDYPLLKIGKVAGFDRAVFGLTENEDQAAVLFEIPEENILISTTKLSDFIKSRYAPKEAMQSIWSYILNWCEGENSAKREISWLPDVRPSYGKDETLPEDAARLAVQRGINWHTNAKMFLNVEGWQEYKELWGLNDSNMHTTVTAINNAAPQPRSEVGDGTYGLLEGIVSEVRHDGSQPTRWWLRSDSNGESTFAFALKGELDKDERSKLIAGNLLDWVYFKSGLFQNDSSKSNYGLLFWAPGNAQALYQDNDIKAILGGIGTSAILNDSRWDEVLVKNILGNFRTTGENGFRGWRLENPDLLREGWQKYWNRDVVQLQPHYEAWTWASYLWLYEKTGWAPLLEKTRKGIEIMMDGYPEKWRWTNGIQQERGRMLLPLAWLIRVDDKPEYRSWLKQIAEDIAESQDESGAIREELGALEMGDMRPPGSNEEYGKHEAPLIQQNGDAVSDLLYTCNFTFLGLHEAYAATGDEQYKRMADKLADFLVRIQIKSEKHPNLDGGWFRAFDYKQWEYWGSNADAGWGAWSIEVGWTQAWIPAVLAMRELDIDLWNISKDSKVNMHFKRIRRQMIPDQYF
jgi:hypothetical protein